MEQYRLAPVKGRFLQSLKAYLGDASFTGTTIGGRHRTLPQLIALIIQRLLKSAEATLGSLPSRVVVGRPVHFTVARSEEHDALAMTRLREALDLAGVREPEFEFEPIAAAYAYQQRLTEPATVLIGDFGGGTSDFSLLALEPPAAGRDGVTILGNDGIAVAGDAFDRAIVRHAVAPQLGKGSEYVSPPDKVLPMPEWVYARLERWHHLSFLKSGDTLDMLRRIRRTSTAPHALSALLALVEEDRGYELHERVNTTKITLSSALDAELRFDLDPVRIEWHATRHQVEHWLIAIPAARAMCGPVDGAKRRLARRGDDRVPDGRVVIRARGPRDLHEALSAGDDRRRIRADVGRHRSGVAGATWVERGDLYSARRAHDSPGSDVRQRMKWR
ncbi:MAG: Hsp70 family protein [Vicinamibacterales bacterium]